MKLYAGMQLEEIANQSSLMGGEIVEDDMDVLARRTQRHDFFQEGDEVAAGMAGGSFSVHASGLGVERRIQRKRAMSVILEAMTLSTSRRERQDRVESIEGLNGGFFVDTEDGCVLRRIQVQADDVGGFAFELGVV